MTKCWNVTLINHLKLVRAFKFLGRKFLCFGCWLSFLDGVRAHISMRRQALLDTRVAANQRVWTLVLLRLLLTKADRGNVSKFKQRRAKVRIVFEQSHKAYNRVAKIPMYLCTECLKEGIQDAFD